MRMILTTGLLLSLTASSYGQTVQIPVVQTFGGRFAVSVPDRGTAHLGSVGRAGEARSQYGLPFMRGSSVGRFTEHSGMTAGVRIVDLHEMDRMILESADSSQSISLRSNSGFDSRSRIAFNDEHSFSRTALRAPAALSSYSRNMVSSRFTTNRKQMPKVQSQRSSSRNSRSSVPQTRRYNKALDPERNWKLGQQAEEAGKAGLAKLHYITAAQHGSVEAKKRLKALATAQVASK